MPQRAEGARTLWLKEREQRGQQIKRTNEPMCASGGRTLSRGSAKFLRGFGGPGRDRTDDLFHAMEARSQLRHRPTRRTILFSWSWKDSSMKRKRRLVHFGVCARAVLL